VDNSRLTVLLLIWLLAAGVLVIAQSRRRIPGTGLLLVYVLNMWAIHWIAPALYLLPGYQHFDLQIVGAGLEQSAYGIVSFVFGSLVLAPLLGSTLGKGPSDFPEGDSNLPKSYLILGIVAYAVAATTMAAIPTATAVVVAGQQLVVVGLALSVWQSWRNHDFSRLSFWLALTLALPFATVVIQGFLGYGIVAAVCVLLFFSGFIKNRAVVAIIAVLLTYLGLSVYVTYMRDRGEIRQTLREGQPLPVRLNQVARTFTDFEWLNLAKPEHLAMIDDRLNQNFLVGLAVNRLTDGGSDYAHGATLWDAALALIPRALWPAKPVGAGSRDLVSEYTGLQFAQGTSVGVGQVMEFYINFGTPGVLLGFALMGCLVARLDRLAGERLASNDLRGFVGWYLPGLSLVQVGGSLVDITATAAASVVVVVLAHGYLDSLPRKRLSRPPGSFSPVVVRQPR
jgi:hypothetical protein